MITSRTINNSFTCLLAFFGKNCRTDLMFYGVDNETGNIFPLKYLCPEIAKFKIYDAISLAFNGAFNPGKLL